MSRALGELEVLLLSAVLRLGDEAYGAQVTREIERRTGREPSPGAVYTGLERLEAKGLLTSAMGEPTPERGGRRKRYYSLEPDGAQALATSLDAISDISRNLRPMLRQLLATGGR